MPLKVVRSARKPTIKAALDLGTLLATIAADVGDVLQLTPLRAAASIILVILQTVQSIEINKVDCFSLARRAAKMLLNIRYRMEGKWEDAPKALVDNIREFELTLALIRDYMDQLAKVKWVGRLLQKASIEGDLKDYASLLDDAERSFQTASLIEIHYTVGRLQQHTSARITEVIDTTEVIKTKEKAKRISICDGESKTSVVPQTTQHEPDIVISERSTEIIKFNAEPKTSYLPDTTLHSPDTTVSKCSTEIIKFERIPSLQNSTVQIDTKRLEEELADLDNHGFKRFHQSEVRLRKNLRNKEGFWSGTSVADVGGQKSIIKLYEGSKYSAAMQWVHDIKILRELFHPNLPQMIGFSDSKAAKPFILLAHVQLRDINSFMWNAIQAESLASCANAMLRMYRDISSATLYIQRQLSMDQNQTQNFVADASYGLDDEHNVIVGIPPPRPTNWYRGFAYGLTESLVAQAAKALPDPKHNESVFETLSPSSRNEVDRKMKDLRGLLRSLLPKANDEPNLVSSLADLIGDGRPVSLQELRSVSITAEGHHHSWREGVHACKVKFSAGDIGFLAGGGRDFGTFEKVGNIFEDQETSLVLVRETIGTLSYRFGESEETWPFPLPDEIEGWPVMPSHDEATLRVQHHACVSSMNEAWRYLLREAHSLADRCGVEPHDMILVSRSITATGYAIRDRATDHISSMQHGHSGFNNPHNPFFGHQPNFHNFSGHGTYRTGFSAARSGFSHGRPVPKLLYLFTSHRADHEPYWSEKPIPVQPESPRPQLPWTVVGRTDWPEAYIDYIQLSKEDHSLVGGGVP